MLGKLIIQDLKKHKLRTFLSSFSISIGCASLIVFLGLSSGIQNATFAELEKNTPLNQITVTPPLDNSNIGSIFRGLKGSSLNTDKIEQISNIPGVTSVYKETQFNNFSSIQGTVFGIPIVTDAMVFGMTGEYLENDLTEITAEEWDNNNSEPYPAVLPRRILDLYNVGIATPRGLPKLHEEALLDKNLILYPNYSTFFPEANTLDSSINLKVVGFSDKTSLLGATLPEQVIERLNAEISGDPSIILQLHIRVNNPENINTIAKKIEDLGFSTNYIQKNIKEIEAKFAYLKIALGSISLIILLTATIAIMSTFLATIAERKKEIGLFRALGATKSHIKKLILAQAGTIGLIGSSIGIIIGLAISEIIDKIGLAKLTETSFQPDSLFNITPELILTTIAFGTILSILAALIPSAQAANLDPMETLKM